MTDIRSAVLWWDEWQLRILVLGSLGLQWFLLLAAPTRKYTIPRWFRASIWLAYISSDALAIYALATLFNRHARASSRCEYCEYAGKASSLEVLWAPLLLVHLGGREEITAYNIEDNELWTRHTVTLVSQVTVALYAFCKSWPSDGNWRLLLSAILLFINGIINFCEKPWALRSASINRLVAVSSIIKGERRKPTGWESCFTELDDRYKCWKEMPQQAAPILSEMDQVQMILSDMSLLAVANDLVKKQKKNKEEVLKQLGPGVNMTPWLRRAFELIYTRANVINAPAYLACNLLLVPALYVAAIALFAVSHKQGYNVTDVKMSYILMCFTAVLDVFGVLISMLVYKLMIKAKVAALCETLPGYNLIDSVLRRMKPKTGWLLKCATQLGYKEDYFSSTRDNLYNNVSQFVLAKLLKGKVEGRDLGSYRLLSHNKDNWALGKSLQTYLDKGKTEPDSSSPSKTEPDSSSTTKTQSTTKNIRRSLRDLPFDESVLVWHIATDLCFRAKPPKYFGCRPPHAELLREICTEAISNYMAHLLRFRPEMLMTGSRQHLFTHAMENLEDLVRKSDHAVQPLDDIEQQAFLAEDIIKKATENRDKYPLIHDACELAQELMHLPADDAKETRWELMYRVWVGMLCYSASTCRGYLHAKSLGEGGEFLSFVWLVISLKGAKTLADKLQMSEEVVAPAEEPKEVLPQAPEDTKIMMPGSIF